MTSTRLAPRLDWNRVALWAFALMPLTVAISGWYNIGFKLLEVILIVAATRLKLWRKPLGLLAKVVFVAMLVWIAYGAVQLAIAGFSRHGLVAFGSLISGLLAVVLMYVFSRDPSLYRALLRGVGLTFLFVGAVGLFEIFLKFPMPNYYIRNAPESMLSGLGAASTFSNPNFFAFYIVVAIPFIAYAYVVEERRLLRVAYALCFALAPLLLFSTQSRMGIVCLGVELLVLFVVFLRGEWFITLAGVIAGVTFVLPLLIRQTIPDWISQHVVKLVNPFFHTSGGWFVNDVSQPTGIINAVASGSDNSFNVRIRLAQTGAEAFSQSHFLGLGPGGFSKFAATVGKANHLEGLTNPHSLIVELMSEYGVIGLAMLLLFVALVLTVASTTMRFPRLANAQLIGSLALIISIVLFPITSAMNSSFITPSLAWLSIILMAGLALRLRTTCDISFGMRSRKSLSR